METRFGLPSRKWVLIEINSALHSNTYSYSLNSLIYFSVFFLAFWVCIDMHCGFLDFQSKITFKNYRDGVWGGGCVTKLKNTYISTKTKTFYPYGKCGMNVHTRSAHDSDVVYYVKLVYFQLVLVFFRCSPTLLLPALTEKLSWNLFSSWSR